NPHSQPGGGYGRGRYNEDGCANDTRPHASKESMNERGDSVLPDQKARTKKELVGVHRDAENGLVLPTEITHDGEVVSNVAVRGRLPAHKARPSALNREPAEHFRFRIVHFLCKAGNRQER